MNNSDIVRQAYAYFGEGNIEGLLSLCSSDVCWSVPSIPNANFGGERRGKPAVAEFFSELVADEEIVHFEPKNFVSEGETVMVLGESRSVVRATNREYSTGWAHAFTVRDGRIVDFHEYFDSMDGVAAFAG